MPKINELIEKIVFWLNPTKERVFALVFSIAFTYLMYPDNTVFDHQFITILWIILGVVIFFIFLAFMTVAGATVLKAFFLFGAEVSLLIFLAQSYCNTEYISRTAEGDKALGALIVASGLYILYLIGQALFKALVEYYKKIEDEKWSFEKIFTVVSFLVFVWYFLSLIAGVVTPIMADICIYRP